MENKKKYFIAILLFIFLGLMIFTFANPKDDKEEDKLDGNKTQEVDDDESDKKDEDDNKEVTEDQNGSQDTNPTNGPEIVDDSYDKAKKLVEELQKLVDNSNSIKTLNTARDYHSDNEVQKAVDAVTNKDLQKELQDILDELSKLLDDTTAPELNVSNGTVYASHIEVTSDDENAKITVTNSEGKTVNGVLKDGKYTVKAVDDAFNEVTVEITVDTQAPKVSGVKNNTVTKDDVTLTVDDLTNTTVKVNGKETEDLTFTKDGEYDVTVTDDAGNSTNVSFTIDKTAPKVSGVENNTVTKDDVTLTVEDLTNTTVKVNGKETKDLTFIEDGEYDVTVTDDAGNSTNVSFTIDKTAPKVSGVENDAVTKDDVTLTVEDLTNTTVKVNGKETEDLTFTEDGKYEVEVTDDAGNSTNVSFTIDKTAPTAKVEYSTVEPTNEDVTVTLKTNESITISEEGWEKVEDNTYSKTFSENTNGGVSITITDLAGNTNTVTYEISNIDKTIPTLTYVNVFHKKDNDDLHGVNIKYAKYGDNLIVRIAVSEELYVKDENGNLTEGMYIQIGSSEDKYLLKREEIEGKIQYINRTIEIKDNIGVIEGDKIPVTIVEGQDKAGNSIIDTENLDITTNLVDKNNWVVLDNLVTASVSYNTDTWTNQDVTATITVDEDVTLSDDSWTKGEDGNYTKTFGKNAEETVIVTDIAGNTQTLNIKVSNIDKVYPALVDSYTGQTYLYDKDDETKNTIVIALNGAPFMYVGEDQEATDFGVSGIASFKVDGEERDKFSGRGNFNKEIEITDNAGNVSKFTVIVDETPATVSDISSSITTNNNSNLKPNNSGNTLIKNNDTIRVLMSASELLKEAPYLTVEGEKVEQFKLDETFYKDNGIIHYYVDYQFKNIAEELNDEKVNIGITGFIDGNGSKGAIYNGKKYTTIPGEDFGVDLTYDIVAPEVSMYKIQSLKTEEDYKKKFTNSNAASIYKDGIYYGNTLRAKVTDTNTVTVTMNGENKNLQYDYYVSSFKYASDGIATLVATDAAGNETVIKAKNDGKHPRIKVNDDEFVTGNNASKTYTTEVSLKISDDNDIDKNLISIEKDGMNIEINDEIFEKIKAGTYILEDGAYYIKVIDKAFNISTASFVVNTKNEAVAIAVQDKSELKAALEAIKSDSEVIYITEDIDLGKWTPAKINNTGENVIINGNGHTINNMTVTPTQVGSYYYNGFIATTNVPLIIENLNFENVEINSSNNSVNDYSGVVVGHGDAALTLNNVHVDGLEITYAHQAGTLVGANFNGDVTFNNCSVKNATLKNTKNDSTSGVFFGAGTVNVNINNSYAENVNIYTYNFNYLWVATLNSSAKKLTVDGEEFKAGKFTESNTRNLINVKIYRSIDGKEYNYKQYIKPVMNALGQPLVKAVKFVQSSTEKFIEPIEKNEAIVKKTTKEEINEESELNVEEVTTNEIVETDEIFNTEVVETNEIENVGTNETENIETDEEKIIDSYNIDKLNTLEIFNPFENQD